jgi:hypothetical protein
MKTEGPLSTEDQAKLEVLRKIAKDAFDSLDRGEGTRVPLEEVGAYLHGLTAKSRERFARLGSELD